MTNYYINPETKEMVAYDHEANKVTVMKLVGTPIEILKQVREMGRRTPPAAKKSDVKKFTNKLDGDAEANRNLVEIRLLEGKKPGAIIQEMDLPASFVYKISSELKRAGKLPGKTAEKTDDPA